MKQKKIAETLAETKQAVLAFFERYPSEVFKPRELSRRLGMREDADYRRLKQALHDLQEERAIRRERRGKFGHLHVPLRVVGVLEIRKQGLGFVTVEGSDERIFIPPRFIGTAMHGDTVEVSLFAQPAGRRQDGDLREGEVVRVIERARRRVVGTLERSRHAYLVVPDDSRVISDVFVAREDIGEAKPGQKVVVEIDAWGGRHFTPAGRIVQVLGEAGEVGAELLSVVHEFNLPQGFPEEVVREAESIASTIPEEELRRRVDLRNLLCVTIDPDDAKDFDDAVSLEPLTGGLWRLGVHIADVSYFVREGSALDTEALKRGTSVYFPTGVIPMLPEKLSNVVCSLRPEEDRLTYSVFMVMSPEGVVKEYDIVESVIRSARRMTYEEVEEILTGKKRTKGSEEKLRETLHAMHALSQALTRKRMREGSIDFETAEAKFRFDEEGKPTEIIKKVRLASHRLVEEFMLAANKTVARHIGMPRNERHVRPFLYRIHESPDPERIRELAAFVEKFGYRLHIDGGVTSKALQKLLDRVRGKEEENVINEVLLRSMAKAVYSERNIGHYGLAFDFYTHFTSPIRRYPDLVVHRLLKRYGAGWRVEDPSGLAKRLHQIARQSSERERTAMEAERAAVKVMQVEYMKRHLGDEFHGLISGVVRYGLFVEINDLLVEGMVHVRDMEDDYYVYDEKKYALIGREKGRQFRLGDRVRVKVVRVNPEEREIDFVLVEDSPVSGRRRRMKS